jgi:hypothetical protein
MAEGACGDTPKDIRKKGGLIGNAGGGGGGNLNLTGEVGK